MADQEIINYFNEMLSRFEALFYHEITGTAVKKVDLIGIDLIQSKEISGETTDELIGNCIDALKAMGIAKDIQFSIHGHGILLKLEVEGCLHIAKESKLKKEGIVPYMCPIANMIGDRLIEVLNYETTYMADMNIDEKKGKCIIKYAIFENIGKIGQVSDWTTI
ncbi:MAG: hypothetical protein JRJ51_08650 [Deltaproteobacteria bacterium]|nr:hypothetical protein [Deltaproteobacteria bacterium]